MYAVLRLFWKAERLFPKDRQSQYALPNLVVFHLNQQVSKFQFLKPHKELFLIRFTKLNLIYQITNRDANWTMSTCSLHTYELVNFPFFLNCNVDLQLRILIY